MIIKSFELEKLKSTKLNIHLIYGNNEGIKEDIINNFYLRNYDGEILKYEEQEILKNKNEFISSLLNKSLFEVSKLIIISRATDKVCLLINEILERGNLETKIIIKSFALEKKSKLRSLFEKEKSLICTPVYEDDARSLNLIINDFLKKNNFNLSQEIKNMLVERSKGDRINLNNELSKLKSLSITKKKIRGKSIKTQDDLHTFLNKTAPGTNLDITFKKKDGTKAISVIRTKNFDEFCKKLIKVWGKSLDNYSKAELAVKDYRKSFFVVR